MTIPAALLSEFDAIDAYMTAVYEVLHHGHMPDLSGLDNRVADLCSAVENAETDIQQECLSRLDHILKRLDGCENEIRRFHAAQIKGNS